MNSMQTKAVEKQFKLINAHGEYIIFNELVSCRRTNNDTWLIEPTYGVIMTDGLAERILFCQPPNYDDLRQTNEEQRLAIYHTLRKRKAPYVNFFQYALNTPVDHPMRRWSDGILQRHADVFRQDPHFKGNQNYVPHENATSS